NPRPNGLTKAVAATVGTTNNVTAIARLLQKSSSAATDRYAAAARIIAPETNPSYFRLTTERHNHEPTVSTTADTIANHGDKRHRLDGDASNRTIHAIEAIPTGRIPRVE